ncbi:hypothetical protein ILYODFUR_002892, partial [Ilyodon furcidens]
MDVLDLQPDCDPPCVHLYLHNLPSNRMVCSKGRIKMTLYYSSSSSSLSSPPTRYQVNLTKMDSFYTQTVPNYQRIVVFRLGRVCPPKGPGIVLVLPLIDQWQRVDLRTRAFNIPPCQ